VKTAPELKRWASALSSLRNTNRPRHDPVVTPRLVRGLHVKPKQGRRAERDVGQAPPAIGVAQISAVLNAIRQTLHAVNRDARLESKGHPRGIHGEVRVAADGGGVIVGDDDRVIACIRRLETCQQER
jgi:hypothetical protein